MRPRYWVGGGRIPEAGVRICQVNTIQLLGPIKPVESLNSHGRRKVPTWTFCKKWEFHLNPFRMLAFTFWTLSGCWQLPFEPCPEAYSCYLNPVQMLAVNIWTLFWCWQLPFEPCLDADSYHLNPFKMLTVTIWTLSWCWQGLLDISTAQFFYKVHKTILHKLTAKSGKNILYNTCLYKYYLQLL